MQAGKQAVTAVAQELETAAEEAQRMAAAPAHETGAAAPAQETGAAATQETERMPAKRLRAGDCRADTADWD